jgi:hypothetical protein
LLSRITARTLRAGDTVYAGVAADWNGDGCVLRQGAVLEGTVQAAQPRHSRGTHSAIALLFNRAECNGAAMQVFELRLEAVGAPLDHMVGELTTNVPTGVEGGAALLPVSHGTEMLSSGGLAVGPAWASGEVVGLRGVRLSVGTGPEGSSVLTRRDLDVELDLRTRLLLVPLGQKTEGASDEVGADPDSTASSVNPAALVAAPAVTVLEATDDEDLDRCIPPECGPEDSAADVAGAQLYVGSIPLGPVGFVPRLNTEILAPSLDDAVAWLGPTELLVAFNPHPLVPRHGVMTQGSTVRVIRAALVDVAKRTIKRTVDWYLPDKGEYLWRLPGNRALVHVGNELRVYGAELRVEKRIELGGGLAFLRVSPDGKTIAVGVVRERHTPGLHAQLVAMLGKDPEEDVQVLLLDGKFETIASALSSSQRLPPALLNEGQVRLIVPPEQGKKKKAQYRLQLRTWSNATRSLGRFTSTCMPEVSTLAPDLVFLVRCDSLNGARDYSVLRPDGRLVLRGTSLLREFGHAASGGGAANTFAVRIFRADGPVLSGEPFHAADLESAELRIYRPQDGKRLFSVRVRDPAASSGGYALSSRGEVAVLGRDGVDVYAMPR